MQVLDASNNKLYTSIIIGSIHHVDERERVRERDLNERVASAVINFQYRSHVPTAITIIGCTKYSNHLLLLFQQRMLYQYSLPHNTKTRKPKICENDNYMGPVKSIHNQLMSSSNQL